MNQQQSSTQRPVATRRRASLTGAAALIAAVATIAGCSNTTSSNSSPSPTNTATVSSAALCADLAALRSDLDQMKALDPNNTTVDQIKALTTKVQQDLNQAAADATGAASVKLSGIRIAYTALTDALNALPSSITASEAYKAVQPQILALSAAFQAARIGTDCPSAAATS